MNDIKRYKKNIRALFPIYSSYEKRFYADLENSITDYTKNSTDVSYTNLEKEFGTPTKIICDYLSNVDTKYLSKQLSHSKYIKISCFIFIFSCIIALSIWGTFYYKAYLDFQNALPTIEETTIEIDG